MIPSFRAFLAVALLALAAVFAPAGGVMAQDDAQVTRGKQLWACRAGCTNCHGWAGNGEAHEPYPPGANLRETTLDAKQIGEVISCGRIATGMPFFDKKAYTDDRCYGVTEADIGTDKPPAGASLRTQEIEAIAAYIVARVKDRGPITAEECQDYFGGSGDCAGN